MISVEGLHGWPDPEEIFGEASTLASTGSEFYDAVGAARNIWRELSAHYWTDNCDRLFAALNYPADVCAQIVMDCTVTIGAAMTLFADELVKLNVEKAALIAEVEAYGAKPAPEEQGPQGYPEYQEYALEGPRLQEKVDDLVRRYEEAVSSCVDLLSAIGDDGSPDPGSSYWAEVPENVLMGAFAAVGEGARIDTTRTTIRVFHWDGSAYQELRPRFEYNRHLTFDWREILQGGGLGEGLIHRFDQAVTQGRVGPPSNSSYWPTKPEALPGGASTDAPTRLTIPGQPEPTRAGRIRLGGPIGLITLSWEAFNLVQEEYAQSDRKFREEHPEMLRDDQRWGAGCAAVVRTAAQIGVSELLELPLDVPAAAAGASILGPVGFTVGGPVGAAVGVAVGAVAGSAVTGPLVGGFMDQETGENKDVGDRVGDFAEQLIDTIFGPVDKNANREG